MYEKIHGKQKREGFGMNGSETYHQEQNDHPEIKHYCELAIKAYEKLLSAHATLIATPVDAEDSMEMIERYVKAHARASALWDFANMI